MDTWDKAKAKGFGKPSIWLLGNKSVVILSFFLSFVLNFTRRNIRDYSIYDHINQSWCNKILLI